MGINSSCIAPNFDNEVCDLKQQPNEKSVKGNIPNTDLSSSGTRLIKKGIKKTSKILGNLMTLEIGSKKKVSPSSSENPKSVVEGKKSLKVVTTNTNCRLPTILEEDTAWSADITPPLITSRDEKEVMKMERNINDDTSTSSLVTSIDNADNVDAATTMSTSDSIINSSVFTTVEEEKCIYKKSSPASFSYNKSVNSTLSASAAKMINIPVVQDPRVFVGMEVHIIGRDGGVGTILAFSVRTTTTTTKMGACPKILVYFQVQFQDSRLKWVLANKKNATLLSRVF